MPWDVILPLIGVVIGAIITGGLQIHNQERAFQFERKKVKDERALLKLEHLMEHVELLMVQFSDSYTAMIYRYKGLSDTVPSIDIKMDKVGSHINLYASELKPSHLKLLKLYSEKWIPTWASMLGAIGEEKKNDALEKELSDSFKEIYTVLVQINIEIPNLAKEKNLV